MPGVSTATVGSPSQAGGATACSVCSSSAGYCAIGATRWLREELREEMHHRLPVLQHVGDAGGRAHIVLEHVELVLADAHDVDADDVAVDVERRVVADHLRQIGLVAEHEVGGDAAGADDLLAVVDVVEKRVQRPHALLDAALEQPPFRGGDDARHEVEGDQPLERVLRIVDGEGDAEPPEQALGLLLLALQLGLRLSGEPFGDLPDRANGPCRRRPASR